MAAQTPANDPTSPPARSAPTEAEREADSLVRGDDRLFDLPHFPGDSTDLFPGASLPSGRRARFPLADGAVGGLLGLEDPYSVLSYDRADGLYIGFGSDLPERRFVEQGVQGWLTLGYAFGSHYWQGAAGLAKDFLDPAMPLRIGIEGHVLTDTRDAWKMGPVENTLFAALAGIDARDYFQRRGFSVSAEEFLNERIGLGLEYRYDSYRSSRREVGWSLFGPKQPFTEVPAVREGPLRSLALHLTVDYLTRIGESRPRVAAELLAEHGVASDDFDQYVLDLRARIPVAPDLLWLNGHVRAGSSTGDAPPQRWFTLGGLGSLPGYPQNGMAGNRMLLVQTEVMLAPFDRIPFRDVRIILENSVGATAVAPGSAGALEGLPSTGDLKHSIGLYISGAGGRIRIGAAARTDVESTPEVVVRLSSPF